MVHASRVFSRLASAAAVVAALVLPAQAGADDFASRTLHQSSAEVRDYWTPERVATARPASELLGNVSLGTLPPAPNERGKPTSFPPASPDRRAGLLDDLVGGGSSSRRSAEPVSNPATAPLRTHGKVLFSLGGTNYQCSGTVVTAKTKRLVVSAGHCVFDEREGGFARNWMFVPAKDGGSEPFGRWTAKRLATTEQWAESTEDSNINNDDVRFDVGFATMQKRNGKRLQKVVGARGIAFNQDPGHFDAFGYPAEPPFTGSEPYVCSSPNQGRDGGPPPRPTRIDCDMTGGSSGGGWVIGGGRINSVVSYGYECPLLNPGCLLYGNPEEGKLFGPYFGETIKNLYRSQRKKQR